MRKRMKVIALALAAVLSVGTAGVPSGTFTVYAQETFDASAHGACIESGKCGGSVKYSLYEDGTLYLSGKGSMKNYDFFSTTPSPFSGNSAIRSLYVQEGITYIGSGSFYECQSLSSVKLPATITGVGYSAFDGTAWMNAQMSANAMVVVNDILINAAGCRGNVTVPSGIRVIGERAFEENAALTALTLPDSVTKIEKEAFYGCKNLLFVTIPDSVTKIGDYAFSGCAGLVSVSLPETMTQLGESVFSDCSSLVSIRLPKGLKKLDKEMFWFCSSLKTVEIPSGITTIESGAFANCTALEAVHMENGILTIKENAFQYCKNMQDITIPASVTKIDDMAFSECAQRITVHGDTGSAAEAYAKKQGMEFTTEKLTIPQNAEVTGDLNGDGVVGLEDAQMILKAALKIITLNDGLAARADMTGDGSISLDDASAALRKALRID